MSNLVGHGTAKCKSKVHNISFGSNWQRYFSRTSTEDAGHEGIRTSTEDAGKDGNRIAMEDAGKEGKRDWSKKKQASIKGEKMKMDYLTKWLPPWRKGRITCLWIKSVFDCLTIGIIHETMVVHMTWVWTFFNNYINIYMAWCCNCRCIDLWCAYIAAEPKTYIYIHVCATCGR